MSQRRQPFDVTLSREKREELARWVSLELEQALSARSAMEPQVEYFHGLYEQARTRGGADSPWPDAADLTSAIATEKVDAIRARLMRTIFTDDIWTVEGWGEAAKKAPFVEEFHRWQAEVEGLQQAYARALHLSLIEPCGVLEVYEDTIRRPIRRIMEGQIATRPDGAAILGEDLKPLMVPDAEGKVTPAVTDPGQPPTPSAEVVVDDFELVFRGPRERAICWRDFLVLPAHAREKSEVWGYAKRFSRRVDELEERVDAGVYDREAVDSLGKDDDRGVVTTVSGKNVATPPKDDALAEKELWEVLFLKSLGREGLRWYVATIHIGHQKLLRLQYDDLGRPRFFMLVPFPRPDSVFGYSFVGNKLITVIEENTAWRNMLADRASLQLQAPLKKMTGALWDPDEEPFGPKAVITVRDMREVEALQLPDYTAPARERILDTERQAEKLAGMSDMASGTNPNVDRTLGESQMIAFNSEVRTDEVLRNLQETLEEIAQVRHLMWKRALATMPDGLETPPSFLEGLERRGADVTYFMRDKRVTAQLLEGAFRFKPKGSVETADRARLRHDFGESLQALASLSKANPMIAAILQQPNVAKALLERWVQLYNVADKQAFLGTEATRMAEQTLHPPMPPGGPPMLGGPPGPPGVAPPGGLPGSLGGLLGALRARG